MEAAGQRSNHWIFNQNLKSAPRLAVRLLQVGFRSISFLAAMFCGSSALAVGFTDLHVQSALGQPLRAQIGLVGSEGNDTHNRCFKAKVRSLEDTSLGAIGIDVKNDGAVATIVLSTTQMINEPAVTLSVEYICESQSRRDYQILLDLPIDLAVNAPSPSIDNHNIEALQSSPGTATAVVQSGSKPKKSRRHHRAAESSAADEHARLQPATTRESNEKPAKKSSSVAPRSVLRLGRDNSVDENLNGVEGMHLALTHSLFGKLTTTEARNAEPAQAAPAGSEAPARDAAGQPTANVNTPLQAANPQIEELQTKIRVLEAETAELRKVNARHLTALAAAPKNQGSNQGSTSSLLYLYFLLFACVAAIAWLVWRTRQIQSEIGHASWSRIVPEPESIEELERKHAEAVADEFQGHEEPFPDHKKAVTSEKVSSVSTTATLPVAAPADHPLQPDSPPAVSEELRENDYKFYTNARSSLPNAEEILDEIQQAEFWMDMQQPQRAIDILESTSSVERPSSPLPWLYLFDLYRLVGSKEKYEELTGRFEHIFNGKVA
ncbi:MAG: FimV family protein, partial [Burkholderiales bacterium]